jgi:hypothetical protein
MSGPNHQGSPLQRPPSTIHHQGVSVFDMRDIYKSDWMSLSFE